MAMNISVDTVTSYIILTYALMGVGNKTIMIPETYEENPFRNQGKMLTQIILDEGYSV